MLGHAGRCSSPPSPRQHTAQSTSLSLPRPFPPGDLLQTPPTPTRGSQPGSVARFPGSGQISETSLSCNTRMSPRPESLFTIPPTLQSKQRALLLLPGSLQDFQAASWALHWVHFILPYNCPGGYRSISPNEQGVCGVLGGQSPGSDSCLCPLSAPAQASVSKLPPRKSQVTTAQVRQRRVT